MNDPYDDILHRARADAQFRSIEWRARIDAELEAMEADWDECRYDDLLRASRIEAQYDSMDADYVPPREAHMP